MRQLEVTINNETGLHARPAKTLVNLVKKFKSNIVIYHGAKKANAKSLISVLTLGASKGSQIKIEVSGEDEENAMAEIESAIHSGLGEGQPAPESPAKSTEIIVAPKVEETALEDKKSGKANTIRGVGAAP